MAEKHPGLTTEPSKDLIDKTLKTCDRDQSGTLSEGEFAMFATKWFEQESVSFLVHLTITSVMTMVVLPGSANIVHERIVVVRPIPRILFKVLFGVGTCCIFLFQCLSRIYVVVLLHIEADIMTSTAFKILAVAIKEHRDDPTKL